MHRLTVSLVHYRNSNITNALFVHLCALHYFFAFIAVDESVLKHRYINMLLEGLDTVADVTLNNVLLLSARNMFRRYIIDVTDIIKVCLNYIHLKVQ